MLRHIIDHEDRVETVTHINAMSSRDQGVLVVHIPAADPHRLVACDLLRSLGLDRRSSDWPRSGNTAWPITRAWLAGYRITRVIAYGAWRLDHRTLKELQTLADDGIDVDVVSTGPTARLLLQEVNSLPTRALHDLLTGPVRRPGRKIGLPPRWLTELPENLAPLPAYDATVFLPRCIDALPTRELKYDLVDAFRRAFREIDRSLDLDDIATTLLDAVERNIRRSRNGNELLIGVRAAQVVALRHGHHLHLPLRHLGFGAAMALRTTADRNWPLPDTINPQLQAIAAALILTKAPLRNIVELPLAAIAPDGTTIHGTPVPVAARPIFRAHRWMHHHKGLDNARAFWSVNKRALRGATARKLLDRAAPDVISATEDRPTRLRQVLNELATVTSLLKPPAATEPPADEQRILPDARYARWLTRAAGVDAFGWTALPGFRETWAFEEASFALGRVVSQATGFPAPEGRLFDAGTASRAQEQNAPHEPHPDDAVILHALLLNVGGGAGRSAIIRALGWTNTRLQRATEELTTRLATTAEIVAETLDSRIELRVRMNDNVDAAKKATLAESDADNGPSIASLRLLARTLLPGNRYLPDDHEPNTPQQQQSRYAELFDRGLVERDRRGQIKLTEDAWLGCCAGASISDPRG